MAEFSKYGAYSVGRLLLHNNRVENDGVQHSNESIDDTRTFYNYHLKKGTAADVQKRLSELFVIKKTGTTVIGEMIVTLPKNVKEEDERDFFQAVYDFYCKDFGEENIVNAVVHKDEKQPHIHLDFIPVLKGEPHYTSAQGIRAVEEWKSTHGGSPPTERICCKDLITRKYLSEMHPRLSDYVKDYLGYETDIQNGATVNGNRTVLQLKADTLRENISRMEARQERLGGDINAILTLAKNNGLNENDIGLYPLLQKIDDLEHRNAVLREIITRQGYSWKKDDLLAMQEKKYVPAKSVPVNMYDGSLVDADIENNAVVVIELPDQASRNSPQRKLIESDVDLERQSKFVQSSARQVIARQSRVSDRIFLFIKTDSAKQTMDNLLLMETQLRELDLKNRKVYMDRMETDLYDLARSIFIKNQIETLYFTGKDVVEKSRVGEQSISQEL